uniref:Gag-Pol polyprotein n=1 Tax=Tanacetum cinerariifolium TaxID=118510 RepID=A0A6L2LQ65_TANCI|nr:Gag-Pol polyprotein [Tanacetum cinerariifolium]
MNVFMRIDFGSAIELVSFYESQVVTFNGEFVCSFRNGDCGTRSRSDNTISSPHGFIIHGIEVLNGNEKVTEVIDVENWRVDVSRMDRKVVQIVLWIVDSGCLKHMTGDRTLLKNFVEKFMGIVSFRNDHFATITGYSDYVQGNITLCHVYYVEGLGHNLFSVRQFCDSDPEPLQQSHGYGTADSHILILTKHDLVDGLLKCEAPPIITTSEEQTSPISLNKADEFNQEDLAEFDGNTLQTDSEVCMYALTVSTLKPKNIKEAMSDHSWIKSMQDKLHEFERLDVWELVPRPDGNNIIVVKWLWKNKSDAEYIVIQNKSRLIAKGYKQEEDIDFKKSFALVARVEAVWIFVAFAAHKTLQSFRWMSRLHFLMVY